MQAYLISQKYHPVQTNRMPRKALNPKKSQRLEMQNAFSKKKEEKEKTGTRRAWAKEKTTPLSIIIAVHVFVIVQGFHRFFDER